MTHSCQTFVDFTISVGVDCHSCFDVILLVIKACLRLFILGIYINAVLSVQFMINSTCIVVQDGMLLSLLLVDAVTHSAVWD